MTITLRTQSATGATTKGSTLTHVELDNNFIDILQNKVQAIDVRGDTGTQLVGQSLSNEILNVVGGTGISTAVTSDSAGQAKIVITNTSSGATITDDTATNSTHYILFDDVTTGSASSIKVSSTKLTFNPSSGELTLAGDFKIDNIVGRSTNGAMAITPNGTGDLQLNADTVRVGDSNANATITTNGTGDLVLSTNEGTNSGTITIFDGTNANIELTPNGTGQVKIDYSLWPVTDGTTGQFLSTNGSGVLSWSTGSTFAPASPGEIGATTPDIGNFTDLKVKAASSTVKELQLYDQDNSNYVGFKSPTTVSTNKVYVLPATDGSPSHVLQTDGAGNLSWAAGSTFAPASPGEIGATTPNIGNFTDLKVKSASSTVKELQLHDQDNSNYVGFKAPTTVSTNKVYVMPAADGTNGQVLSTNGSATLSWVTAGGGGNSYAVLEHNSNSLSVNAGTGTLNVVWTEASDINGIVSVGGDTKQFILTAGTYLIRLSSAGMLASGNVTGSTKGSTGGMYFDIYDVTNSTARHRYYQEGTNIYNGGSTQLFETAMGPVFLEGIVTPTGSTTYEIRYDNATTQKQFNNYSSPGKAFRILIVKLA